MTSVAERLSFYKAATTSLTGPHYGGLTYLPGSHHALGINDPFDSDPNGWCTAGLYVTSHQRVAARWGPVVLNVLKDKGAPLVKTTKKHKPTGVPAGVDSGSYAKYRTTGFTVLRIVGIAAYGFDHHDSYIKAKQVVYDLNRTLRRHGLQPVEMLAPTPLQVLRDERYCLWGVEDPNEVKAQNRLVTMRHPRVRHRLSIEFFAERQLTEAEIMSLIGDQVNGSEVSGVRMLSLR